LYIFLNKIPVLEPKNSLPRFLLDIIILLSLIYRVFMITIKLSFFNLEFNQSFDLIPDDILIFLILVFFLELIINLNSGFFQEGNLILDRKSIFHYRILNWIFLFNLLSHIPYIFYHLNKNGSFKP
jgi:hypothetical protein